MLRSAVADPLRFHFGYEPVMREAEQRGQDYLFKLRLTTNVKRAIERAIRERDWQNAGRRWQGSDGQLRLEEWSRQCRIVIAAAAPRTLRGAGSIGVTAGVRKAPLSSRDERPCSRGPPFISMTAGEITRDKLKRNSPGITWRLRPKRCGVS
jgi:hypothetical protein